MKSLIILCSQQEICHATGMAVRCGTRAFNMKTGKDKSLLSADNNVHSNSEASVYPAPRAMQESRKLVHELEVHQIELEMQNDELRQAQKELELSRNKYLELYDFAPVAYFTFNEDGVVLEANLTAAHMMGIEREMLLRRPFSMLVADADGREVFFSHLSLVLQRQGLLRCEIKLTRSNGTVLYGQLRSVPVTVENGKGSILTVLADITVRKELEDKLLKAHDNLELTVQERTKELTARTSELTRVNKQLTREIAERKKAEEALSLTCAELKGLQDRLQAENIYLQQEVDQRDNFGEIIGQSPLILRVFTQIEQVAPMNATILLLGETGTGKGLVARAIHSSSSRKARPLITVNCTTLPASLVESELFGRERGAFTGSDARQIGRFELADGGTIFLDEIGEMPLELQSKLLRVIQDGEFERLGSPRTIKTDVRIIAATNRDLKAEVQKGTFREDLFYRLNVFPITMPPLRQRRDDIPLLVNHFVAKFNKKIGKRIETVSKDTLNTLQEYHWPGNVRELESIIERAVIISQGTSLQVLDRFDTSRENVESEVQDFKDLAGLEHNLILQTLQKTAWRIEGKRGAALLLGLNPSTLRFRMRKYGISRQ
ncbi:MAG: sigma 54-interacting transcriptional regulator [Geobacteraceae bacterium]|nr:sigma 54-interacting transcriptional regulator [Geobacteraceae bacterium]